MSPEEEAVHRGRFSYELALDEAAVAPPQPEAPAPRPAPKPATPRPAAPGG